MKCKSYFLFEVDKIRDLDTLFAGKYLVSPGWLATTEHVPAETARNVFPFTTLQTLVVVEVKRTWYEPPALLVAFST